MNRNRQKNGENPQKKGGEQKDRQTDRKGSETPESAVADGQPGERSMFDAGMTFTAAILLPVIVTFLFGLVAGSLAQTAPNAYRYTVYLIPQLCFFAAAIFCFVRSKTALRPFIKRTVRPVFHPKYILLAVLMQFGLFSLNELNGLFLQLLSLIGYEQSPILLPDLTGWNLLPALLVIAVLPAIFEETVFRGIMVGRMQESGWGTASTVLISGLLFALFHTNPAQTAYQFVCGACFALIAVRSGSMVPTMVSHFLNNAAILVLTAFSLDEISAGAPAIIFYSLSGVCLAAVLGYLVFFDKNHAKKGSMPQSKPFFLGASVGIVLALVTWIATLALGMAGGNG